MKSLKYKGVICLITLALGLFGCNPPGIATGREDYKSYGEQIEDRKIINNIQQNFRNNPAIPAHLVHLSIDRGIVQLSGFVHNTQEANLIILSTFSTPGVKDVIDSLVILSGSEYARRRAIAESRDTKR